MNSVILLLSALLTFASWVDAAIPFPNADESKSVILIRLMGKNAIEFNFDH